MKRFLLALFIAAYALSVPAAANAFADAKSYARAAVNDAYFFLDKDESSSLFIVPYTYCIQIVRDEGDWYYASYGGNAGIYKEVFGYCRKQDFTRVEGTPSVTYLYKTVSVTYRTDDGTSPLPVLGEISVEAAFYGNFYSGATAYSYVYAQGSFGYIKGAIEDYPLNSDENGETDSTQTTPSSKVNVALVTALIICALAALALIMLYFTSRKKGRTEG